MQVPRSCKETEGRVNYPNRRNAKYHRRLKCIPQPSRHTAGNQCADTLHASIESDRSCNIALQNNIGYPLPNRSSVCTPNIQIGNDKTAIIGLGIALRE